MLNTLIDLLEERSADSRPLSSAASIQEKYIVTFFFRNGPKSGSSQSAENDTSAERLGKMRMTFEIPRGLREKGFGAASSWRAFAQDCVLRLLKSVGEAGPALVRDDLYPFSRIYTINGIDLICGAHFKPGDSLAPSTRASSAGAAEHRHKTAYATA